MNPKDPIAMNIEGVQQLVGSKLNKINSGATNQLEGVDGAFEDSLTLTLPDDKLIALSRLWTANYNEYEGKIKIRQQANETYYLGKQKEGSSQATDGQPIAANLIFEAEETFLPAAFAKNPEPVVWSDGSKEGEILSNDVKTMLQYHASVLLLRRKLQKGTRKWTIDLIGVWKHGWDDEIKEICLDVRNARDFIFDKDGFVDEYGDFIGCLGERISVTAERLCDLFPNHEAFITIMVDGKMGTNVTYTEWWNDDYTFITFRDKVLDKSKNPHFNYSKKTPQLDELNNPILEEDGSSSFNENKVRNHFFKPKKPYTFLSVFSLGNQPHDNTGLIEQNIPNQRRISRRTEQIDYNLSRSNNATIYSEDNFNQETAKQAATARTKGHPILVPKGRPLNEAMLDMPAVPVAPAFFNELEISKNDLRSSFGTEGITAQAPEKNELATGLILNENHDSSRISGGIGDAIEQVAYSIFNWWVQLYMVYYDEPHEASIMGKLKAVEFVQLSAEKIDRKLVISVSPNSMKPKDEVAEMNQAVQLFEMGILDPKTLFTKLNFSDPQETAKQATLWAADKQAYIQLNFPDLAQQLSQMQQQSNPEQEAQAMQAAQGQQQLQQKDAEHNQKMTHAEQLHEQKMKLSSKPKEK